MNRGGCQDEDVDTMMMTMRWWWDDNDATMMTMTRWQWDDDNNE